MRKATKIITRITVLFMLLISVALADTFLDDDVPFGLTCSKDGQYIPVLKASTQKPK